MAFRCVSFCNVSKPEDASGNKYRFTLEGNVIRYGNSRRPDERERLLVYTNNRKKFVVGRVYLINLDHEKNLLELSTKGQAKKIIRQYKYKLKYENSLIPGT